MSSITTSPLAGSIVKNPVVWSLTVLAVLALGIASASTPLLIVSGLLAFGRPLLYAGLLRIEDEARQPGAARTDRRLPFERRASQRVGALGVF
jgi:hypothetical protein